MQLEDDFNDADFNNDDKPVEMPVEMPNYTEEEKYDAP